MFSHRMLMTIPMRCVLVARDDDKDPNTSDWDPRRLGARDTGRIDIESQVYQLRVSVVNLRFMLLHNLANRLLHVDVDERHFIERTGAARGD
ncbi:hypothetical protein CBR_g3498 [Chara braunii]|uniref:Uncharacterized protein n=1 Tax=Chara braunii TaxID=69332 RepID=A0A388JR17_CHABU|nr:hypothetical protein CBR_g3498 [Chara braunii]|eukprot:GBG60254.1 hypothetical protein CBR_g3498 [Chara braunii]